MHVRVAESGDCIEMDGGRVALVSIEAVSGVAIVELEHLTIAGDLGHDRGGSDGRTATIAVQHATLGHRQTGHMERVDEHDIWQWRE